MNRPSQSDTLLGHGLNSVVRTLGIVGGYNRCDVGGRSSDSCPFPSRVFDLENPIPFQ